MKFPECAANCFPPGLWVPTADEDTAQYRSGNYVPSNLDYWQIVDFGIFAVALASFDVAEGKRESLMPTKQDLNALRKEGFGPSFTTITHSGGLKKLQSELGFYPYAFRPTRDELLKRYEWIAEEVMEEGEPEKPLTVKEIIDWCSLRDYAPHSEVVYDILDDDANPIRQIFGLPEIGVTQRVGKQGLYAFGARVLLQKGGIVPHEEMNSEYTAELGVRPITLTEEYFGGNNRFWLEFGRVTDTTALTQQDLVNLATRLAIRTGERGFSAQTARELAEQQLLPSRSSISKKIGGLPKYRELIQNNLKIYGDLVREMQTKGVDERVTRAFSSCFEPTEEFKNLLVSHAETMLPFCDDTKESNYILKLIANGLDLVDEYIFELQIEDMIIYLKRVGITEEEDLRFIFSVMPLVDPEAMLDIVNSS